MKLKTEKQDDKHNQYEGYARYSSIALQMFAIIAVGIFGGVKLDQWLKWKFPVFTVICSIVFVSVAIYIVIKELLNNK